MTVDNYEEFVGVITTFVVNAPAENQTDDNLVIVIETARSSSEVLAFNPETIVTEEVRVLWIPLPGSSANSISWDKGFWLQH